MYYYCQIHSGMGGTINIRDISASSGSAGSAGSSGADGNPGTSGSAGSSGVDGVTTLSALTDTNVTGGNAPTDGQVLTWDNGNSYWKPTTVSGGGGSSTFVGLTDSPGSYASTDADKLVKVNSSYNAIEFGPKLHVSTSAPASTDGNNGDYWFQYTP